MQNLKLILVDPEFSGLIAEALTLLSGPKPAVIDVDDKAFAGGKRIGEIEYEEALAQGDNGSWIIVPYFGDNFGGCLRWQHGMKITGLKAYQPPSGVCMNRVAALATLSRSGPPPYAIIPQLSLDEEGTKCILCACCTSSCPVTWGDPAWVGPVAIVNAHRFLFDSRDHGAAERLAILSDRLGVFRCRTVFNCTGCCPRGIPVTDLIEQVKRALLYGSTESA